LEIGHHHLSRIVAFVSLGERLSGDCLGEANEETACNFLPDAFFSCFMFDDIGGPYRFLPWHG